MMSKDRIQKKIQEIEREIRIMSKGRHAEREQSILYVEQLKRILEAYKDQLPRATNIRYGNKWISQNYRGHWTLDGIYEESIDYL